MYYLLFLNLIVPFVMILVGGILKKYPISDMSKQNGYNTPTSRKSQEHWEYAQSIAPHIFIFTGKILGVVEIVLSVVMFLLHVPIHIALIVGGCAGFGFMFYSFCKTDSEIEKKFLES